ncbi:MAG TPA: superoxide dismutase [Cu-Zn] SodC [Reyranella sp.]|nr:superoxide dismutase [Cu-Zn] SodC [Reyranella sp.]
MKHLSPAIVALALALPAIAHAETVTVVVNSIDANGIGYSVGTLTLEDTSGGLKITPKLAALPPGAHGFHVHANGDCGPGEQNGQKVAGLAAGGHFDPAKTGKHLGPASNDGHKGDMPVLTVGADGTASTPVVVPHLSVADAKGHAIVIHAGGDNYSDQPAPLGGGGARIACGIVK